MDLLYSLNLFYMSNKYQVLTTTIVLIFIGAISISCDKQQPVVAINNKESVLHEIQKTIETPTTKHFKKDQEKHNIEKYKVIDFLDLQVTKKGWRVYKNKNFGFQVEIPDGWTILEVPEFNRVQFFSDGVLRDGTDKYAYMDESDMNIFYDQKFSGQIPQNEISIDGYPAIKQENILGGDDPDFPSVLYSHTNIYKTNSMYQVNFLTHKFSQSQNEFKTTGNEKLFNEILSSFKFLENE